MTQTIRNFLLAQLPALFVSDKPGDFVRLFSYIVARDFGFAPNPFYGVYTLATCKPKIRGKAQVGDWIVGTGSKPNRLEGHIVFTMCVSEVLTYDEYWNDECFRQKRAYLRGSLKQAYGDNIYHRDAKTLDWRQADSHHSLPDGSPNQKNIFHDTQLNRVLIGEEFYYWGRGGPKIASLFRNSHDYQIQYFPNEQVL